MLAGRSDRGKHLVQRAGCSSEAVISILSSTSPVLGQWVWETETRDVQPASSNATLLGPGQTLEWQGLSGCQWLCSRCKQ